MNKAAWIGLGSAAAGLAAASVVLRSRSTRLGSQVASSLKTLTPEPRSETRAPRTTNDEGFPFARDLRDLVGLKRSRAHSLYRQRMDISNVQPDLPFRRKLVVFLSGHIFAWIANYLRYRFTPRHRFVTYRSGETGVYPLRTDSGDGVVRLSFAGDWGTGTEEAYKVGRTMEAFRPHYTIHLGDVYYVGDKVDVQENCLGVCPPGGKFKPVKWPEGSIGQLAMNGNHEMYANGIAYFELLLKKFGVKDAAGLHTKQRASYFCLESDYWQIIALDTGYTSVGLPIIEDIPWFAPPCDLYRAQLPWLQSLVNRDRRRRGKLLLTHHQPFSAFEQWYPSAAVQLKNYFDKPVLWLWGHEHRMAIYGRFAVENGLECWGRCIGHGGMPVDLVEPKTDTPCPLVAFDGRVYQHLEDRDVGYNGSVNITITDRNLSLAYLDLNGTELFSEIWTVDEQGFLHNQEIGGGELLTRCEDLQVAVQ